MRNFCLTIALIFSLQHVFAQSASLVVKTWVDEAAGSRFKDNGRIFLFVGSARYGEPRLNTLLNKEIMIFA